MKKWMLLLGCIFSVNAYLEAQSNLSIPVDTIPKTHELEQIASFPGGEGEMMLFLKKNLIYPIEAKELGIQGKCYVQFIVSSTGKITSPKILRGIPDCPACDQECLRVIRLMPDWTPAKVKNRAVNSYYQIPFTFKMN